MDRCEGSADKELKNLERGKGALDAAGYTIAKADNGIVGVL